jgi:uncharacterized protein
MNLLLRELASKDEPLQLRGELDMTSVVSDRHDIRTKHNSDVQLLAKAETDTITVTGSLAVNLEFDCAKCLKAFEERLVLPVCETFTQQTRVAQKNEDIHLVTEDRVDITPYLHELLIVNLPLAPVCQENCKGLCPRCGNDRNISNCECIEEELDPRLAKLKKFLT